MVHNTSLGLAAGVSSTALEALRGNYRTSGLFSDRELAVIAWAESVALNTARRNHQAFETLRRHLSVPEIVELTVVAAHRTMINRIQEALWTDLEGPEVPANTRAQMSEDILDGYIREVLCAPSREDPRTGRARIE